MGEAGQKQVLETYSNKILPSGHPASIYVNRVAKRLLGALNANHLGKKSDIRWKVIVINADEPNA